MTIIEDIKQLANEVGWKRVLRYLPVFKYEYARAALPGNVQGIAYDSVESNLFNKVDGKRIFDIYMSLIILLAFMPVMVTLSVAIWLSSMGRAPVFYRQQRVGLNGQLFDLIKFRSMTVDAESNGARKTAEDDPRITRIGRVIRRYRIDELPQLFLVLKGEMSLVGPRPERPEFVRYYNDQISGYYFRHKVKPGLTGWAQVSLGYGDSVEDAENKLFYDLSYIQKHCLGLDINIIIRTIPVMLFGNGAR
jgi:exopolysaccharide biosynthesis polyprenyl glycosylphosphotransferase